MRYFRLAIKKILLKPLHRNVKYTITGDGVVHVRASDISKTDQFKRDLEIVKRLGI